MTPAQWLAKQIETGDPDLLRSMMKTMAETLLSAEADSLCGARLRRRPYLGPRRAADLLENRFGVDMPASPINTPQHSYAIA